jgi:hypothetical protein
MFSASTCLKTKPLPFRLPNDSISPNPAARYFETSFVTVVSPGVFLLPADRAPSAQPGNPVQIFEN